MDTTVTSNQVYQFDMNIFPNYPQVPVEICLNIFEYLPPKNLANICLVNNAWKDLSEDNTLWPKIPPSQFFSSSKSKSKEVFKDYQMLHSHIEKGFYFRKTVNCHSDLFTSEVPSKDKMEVPKLFSDLLITKDFLAYAFLDKSHKLNIQIIDYNHNKCVKTLSSLSWDLDDKSFFFLKSDVSNENLFVYIFNSKGLAIIQIFDLKSFEEKETMLLQKGTRAALDGNHFQIFEDLLFLASQTNKEIIIYNWKKNVFVSKFLPYEKNEYNNPSPWIRLYILGVTENRLITSTGQKVKIWDRSDYSCIMEYENLYNHQIINSEIYCFWNNFEFSVLDIPTGKIKPAFFPTLAENEFSDIINYKIFDSYLLVIFKDAREGEKNPHKIKVWNRNNGNFLFEILGNGQVKYVQGVSGKLILSYGDRKDIDCYDFN